MKLPHLALVSMSTYLNPVGPISLMANHGDAIVNKSEPEAAAWPLLFNDWALSGDDSDRAVNNQAANNAARRGAALTPVLCKPCPSINISGLTFVTPTSQALDDGLDQYEKVWQSSADADGSPLPTVFSIGELLRRYYQRCEEFARGLDQRGS